MGAIGGLLILLIVILLIVSLWKIFTKAGKPGWASIVPIYNSWVLAEIGGKPGWWGLLMLIPYVNIVIAFYLYYLLAKSFGKGAGYAIGMILLPFIFLPMLAFGDDKYQGPPVDNIIGELEE